MRALMRALCALRAQTRAIAALFRTREPAAVAAELRKESSGTILSYDGVR